jgi:hypothetical protein
MSSGRPILRIDVGLFAAGRYQLGELLWLAASGYAIRNQSSLNYKYIKNPHR